MNTADPPDPLVLPIVRGRPPRSLWILAWAAALAAVAALLVHAPRDQSPVTLLIADLSQSMRAGSPPRYIVAAQAMEGLASRVAGKIGLICCASGARLASPPSLDREKLLQTLGQLRQEAARPELIPAPSALSGTRLAGGLRMAHEMLSHTTGPRNVILFSDGDDPVPDDTAALEAARLAAIGVKLHVVQVGTPGLAESIPMTPGDFLLWQGRPVQSTVGLPYLQSIATAAGTALTTRWQTIDCSPSHPWHLQSLCLLASLLLWLGFLTASSMPTRPISAVPLALLILAISSCQGEPNSVPTAKGLLRQAAALPPTNLSRAAIAREAEKMARQETPSPTSTLDLLEALILAGESVPMDRQALLAAQELALESETLLKDRLTPVLARIRLRLAQCKPDPTTQQQASGDLQPGESQGNTGDPGSTRFSTEPSPLGKPGKPLSQPTGSMAEAALPGPGRLPVLLDDSRAQPLTPAEAEGLLRAASRWRQNRESVQRAWERPATGVPDW